MCGAPGIKMRRTLLGETRSIAKFNLTWKFVCFVSSKVVGIFYVKSHKVIQTQIFIRIFQIIFCSASYIDFNEFFTLEQ